ncbi:hypothetical protein MATL_G00242400 [Megalops atlanticus]|uniref:Glypican-5-like n=1 Tax=Megalops atlanticus TaxID=7932 RepID=A0A9D3PF31_MEGAT|nr:hypothetical protein MATL_G00242400 [Megalops atlanticus]
MSRGIFPRVNFWWILASFALLLNVSDVKPHSCHEVKTAFQVRQIGPLKWVPETPGTDVDLQICKHNGPTCCTRKMEENYLAAVKRETVQNIRSYSFELKYLIMSHAAAFQDTFQSLVSFSMSHVSSLFDTSHQALAQDASGPVAELFSDLALFIRGGNASVESADVNPFGPHPQALARELSRSLRAGRALSRALAAGEEALNATEQAAVTRECARALVRMQYCSHCRGLTLIKPCAGYCLNVMRGCLAGLSELDRPWRRYVAILQDISASMADAHELELSLLGVRAHIADAIAYAQEHAPQLTATVDKVCGQPAGTATSAPSPVTVTPPVTPTSSLTPATPSPPPSDAPLGRLAHLRRSLPLKPSKKDKPKSLKKISRELMVYIRNYKSFFGGLPDLLCEGETVVDDFNCWSGDDVVPTSSYTNRVVDSGLQAQRQNPEVKVRSPDALLAEVKEKLERFNQEMEDSSPGWGTRGAWADIGSGTVEASADCDDEDGCQGSGEGTVQAPHEEQTVSVEWVPQEKGKGENVPHWTSTITPRRLVPKASGRAPSASVALPTLALLLSALVSQWTLL